MPVKTVQDIVFIELLDLQVKIAENIKSTGRNASGHTANSMHIVKTGKGATLLGRDAFEVLETGRKSGKVPKGFYQIIRQWAIDKGFSFESDRELNTFAYLTSRKIVREGTKLYRDGGERNVFTEPKKEALSNIKIGIALLMADNILDTVRKWRQ